MNPEKPDLRYIDFRIIEEPGNFITTPEIALKMGIRATEEEVFICTDCKQPIDRKRQMFLDMQEPMRGWRHAGPCEPSCHQPWCRFEDGKTRHDTRCEEYGPGWA
jgi:hypothetical protein